MSHMKKCFRAKSAFYTLCWHMTNCFSWKSTHRFQKRHWVTLQLCQSNGLHWIICVFFPECWTETTALIHVVFIWFNFFKISLDLSLFLVLFRNFLRKVVIFFHDGVIYTEIPVLRLIKALNDECPNLSVLWSYDPKESVFLVYSFQEGWKRRTSTNLQSSSLIYTLLL